MARQTIDPRRIGEEFQSLTKYRRDEADRGALWSAPTAKYKSYPAELRRVALPPPDTGGGPRLWRVISARRSTRQYGKAPLDGRRLSQLLWAAQGITGEQRGTRLRAAPSAGALYPLETYIVLNNAEGMERGLYHYNVLEHGLVLLRAGDLRERLAAACLGQEMPVQAAAVFMWTAVAGRSAAKYGQRAYRYLNMEAGHAAQNMALACAGMDLGFCMVGAMCDDELNELLDVDGSEETILCLGCVGPLA